jgi:hypothetical protein
MMETVNQKNKPNPPVQNQQRRPNEQGTINVSGFIKIYDPNNKQIFVETRE